MTVKLAILKSGEDVIADIQEMVVGSEENQKVIGYIFNRPCVVKLLNSNKSSFDKENKSFEINIFPWCPLSKDTRIPVIVDWVVTLVEPADKLKTMYEDKVLKYGTEDNQNIVSDEQSDSDQSD
jgi:hypothetical protein